MPPLSVPMNPLCDVTFVGQMKKMPINWQQPQGEKGQQYNDAFAPADHAKVPVPMCYFWAASTNDRHVKSATDIGDKLKAFCHSMLDGFKSAVDMWRTMAMFKNIMVNGPTALGQPGCLSGPELEPFIKNMSLPAATGNEQKWRDAVAKGLSKCWKDWQDQVMVPGLPLYPAFAAFPGPMGPPMPNIPVPLITCPSPGMAKMAPPMLKQAMKDSFSLDDPDDHFGATAMAIATAVNAAFMAWLPSQMVMNMMGTGPIPTFVPPYVPVGPVLQGQNIPAPNLIA